LLGPGGSLYLTTSVLLSAAFVGLALRVYRVREGAAADCAARSLFAFSIIYLFALFAALLVESLANRMPGLGWALSG
jgi:protoheme IX farnesyltransferase